MTKHLNSTFNKPYNKHNIDAYHAAITKTAGKKIIFDSGCGNGRSTRILAENFPDAFVIGIDKSTSRIDKGNTRFSNGSNSCRDNFCIVRADITDFWRLAVDAHISLYKHFIFYPNPWPKSQHFKRRWHGSPLFKTLLQLSGQLELRSNWPLYVTEFQQALALADIPSQLNLLSLKGNNDITDFETKYRRSGHSLWQLNAELKGV